jgi:hypothetical protein
MGLVIKIKNIVSPNNFKLFYKEGRTPGSSSEQLSPSWGVQFGGTYSGGTSEILVDINNQQPYGKQYWFKILDIVTNSFIIENIYIHEKEFYDFICATPTPTPTITLTPTFNAICTFTGGSAIVGLTPTPTPTMTPTPNCQFSGGSAEQTTTTPTPTPTLSISPTLSITPTFTITPTVSDKCIIIDYYYNSNSGLADGCGGFQRTDTTIRATLYNNPGGSPVNSTENISIQFTGTTSDCLGSTVASVIITINSGTSYGEVTYTSLTYEPCPYDQNCNPVSTSIDGVLEISPIQYVQCPTPTPTPTLTITPTFEPIVETWCYSDGSVTYGPFNSEMECSSYVNNPNSYVCSQCLD